MLKPAFSAAIVNLLGGNALKVYRPLAPEVVVWALFVSVSVRVIVAPGITAPDGSVTVPVMEARYCA